MGYIKDYDGGTLMECYVHPNVDYLNVKGIVAKQRAFILQRLKERSEYVCTDFCVFTFLLLDIFCSMGVLLTTFFLVVSYISDLRIVIFNTGRKQCMTDWNCSNLASGYSH